MNHDQLDPPFIPVGFAPSPALRDPDAPPSARPGVPEKGRWGGPRPNSGPPFGNLNALKHGRSSKRQSQLLALLVEIPAVREGLVAMAKRNRQRRQRAEAEAGRLLSDWVRQNNHLANDQVVAALAALEHLLKRDISGKRPRSRSPRAKTTKPSS